VAIPARFMNFDNILYTYLNS